MDVDTTRQKGSHTRILKEFQEGKAQILVGTQMIAKGLDFPSVTLVGIINPDTLINMPDFQAVERAFQLLTQVAGRAGRGDIPGEVIIQTYNPENYLYPSLVRYDYDSFCEGEMANRSLLQYPPYTMLARVLVSGIREEGVRDRVENLAKMLKIEIERKQVDVEILGPSPAPISLIKNRYRYHLILKGSSQPILQELALYLRCLLYTSGNIDDEKIVDAVKEIFDLRPAGIIKSFDLRRPIYKQTAAYGHFGRPELDLPWERLDKVKDLKSFFNLK